METVSGHAFVALMHWSTLRRLRRRRSPRSLFYLPLEYSALREAWGALSHEVVFLADRLLPLARVVGETGRVQFKRHILRAGLRWASGSSAALPFSRCLLVPLADAVPQLLAPWLRQQEPHLRLEDARVTARAWIVPPRVGAGQYLSSMKCFCQHTLGNATRSTPESSVAAGKILPDALSFRRRSGEFAVHVSRPENGRSFAPAFGPEKANSGSQVPFFGSQYGTKNGRRQLRISKGGCKRTTVFRARNVDRELAGTPTETQRVG